MWVPTILAFLLLLFSGFLKAEVCPFSDTESLLQPGKDYLYKFESEALTATDETTNDKSKISIKCGVAISHSTKCFYSLQMNNCIVNAAGGPPESETAWIADQHFPDLSKYPILFSLVNGEVSEVYTDERDPIYFINIKKGALSAFVFKLSYTNHAMKEMHTDIHGTCPLTSAPLNDTEGSVRTSKDMLHCAFPSRKDWQFSPYSLFWNMSFIQNVINSTTDCDYDIIVSEKRLNKVNCKERHSITLQSLQPAVVVQSHIHYTMTYVNSSSQVGKKDVSSITRKTDIRFEYERTPDPQSNPENFLPIAKKMLADLVEESTDEIRLLTIPQFTDFVAWIRSSNNLIPFLETVKSCSYLTEAENCSPLVKELGLSYLKDALIQCNSLPCIEAISYLVKNKDFSLDYLSYYSWSSMHFSKAAILKHVMSICRDTDSDLCWTSFGNLVRKVYLKQQNAGEDNKLLQDIARYFYGNIERLCVSLDSNPKSYSNLLRDLKTIKNMEGIYLLLIPEGSQVLTDCILKSNVPEFIKTFALETLQAVHPCHDNSSCESLYNKLLPILRNTATSTTLRALAYENIISTPQNYGFEKELFEILKTDENIQLKSYIATNLKSLFQDGHFTDKDENYRFMRSMNWLLYDNDMSLNEIIYHPEARSISEIKTYSTNLPFMPEEMQRFSYKTTSSKIFESYDVIPRYLNNDLTVEIFGELIRIFRTGGYSEGLENAAIVFQRFIKNYNKELPSFENLLGAIKEIAKEFKPEDSSQPQEYSFHENIIQNVRKLEEMYRKYRPKKESFFKFFSDFFGSPSGYFSSQDLSTTVSELLEMHTILENLERGVKYNTTRVIRIIEAYHQVPTMMGLPLNWTTNATLAFSVRSGLKMKLNPDEYEIHSQGFFQPSAALTFINRMVIDFPTITQIGVQANSSGYTSTQWKAKLEYSKEKKAFRFYKPNKSQKILELYQTNQLIKHNTYQDIEDRDFERTSSSSCTKKQLSSLLGLQICLSKSYPVVSTRLKPWTLMSGYCKWQFLINPFDKKIISYDIETVKPSEPESTEFIVKFSTSGSEKKREVFFKSDIDKSKKDIKLQVIVPELPDFSILYSQNIPLGSSKENKQRNMVVLKLDKDTEYQVMYNDERKDRKDGNSTNANESSEDEELISFVHEQLLTINTPSSSYRYSREDYKNGNDENSKVLISYENMNPSQKWLHKIIPPSMWETDTKAWVQLRIDWKGTNVYTLASTRQILISIKDPQTTIDFIGNSFKMMGREQTSINVTKTEISSGKLLGFANFTINEWNVEDDFSNKEITSYNLTISRKSWAFQLESIREREKIIFNVMKLKMSAMIPQNEVGDYVGWWSKEASQNFRIEEKQLKFVIDVDMPKVIENEKVLEKYPSVKQEHLGDLSTEIITASISFYYPIAARKESVTFVGALIASDLGSIARYHTECEIASSYHNASLKSQLTLNTNRDSITIKQKAYLYFSHIPNKIVAYNTFDYWITYGQCKESEFKHTFDSEALDVSTNVSYKCNSDRKDMHTLLLHSLVNSTYWDMLNLEINQIVEDISPEYKYESCNFTHPLLLINVTADWIRNVGDHKKKVLFTCTEKDCKSTELYLEWLHNGKMSAKLIMPDDQNRKLYLERTLALKNKNMNLKINYADDLNDESKEILLKGEILNNDHHIWNLKLNVDTYSKIKSLLEDAYEDIAHRTYIITKDPKHPLNRILEPYLKESLYNYYQDFKMQRNAFFSLSWKSVKETIISLRPFYEVPVTLLNNIASAGKTISLEMYNSIKDRSGIIWAINYFDLPSYFYKAVTNVKGNVYSLMNMLTPDDKIIRYEFVTGKIIKMYSFKQIPTITLDDIWEWKNPFSKEDEDKEIEPNPHSLGSSKMAMIYGPLHVYTFDKHTYDSAEYSSDCMFLLAHDLRKSTFTALSDEKTIHVLFPEMTVSVSNENVVFINGSDTPSKLPVEADNGRVVVRRSDVVEIWSPTLRVICSARDFLCIFELSTWHNGGTFGLLGNADGLWSKNFSLPNNKRVSEVLEFVTSYEVSGKSKCKNLNLRKKSSSNLAAYICSSRFYALCRFDNGILEAFSETCKSDVEAEKSNCYSSAAYSALCYYKNLKSGTDCNSKSQEDTRISKKLEVVFIVHEHKSFVESDKNSSPYKGMEKMLSALNDKFVSGGYSSILFSLIGFGGKDTRYQPTVHAKQSISWMPLSTIFLDDMLKHFQFNGDKEIDVLKVLKFAAKVKGYDTFDSKIFILLTTEDKQSKNKQTVKALQHFLNENGITLYTFASYPSIEKGNKVFGIRADGLIFPSPKKNGTAFLDYPKGDLAKLTSSTRGSLFLKKFVSRNQPSFSREFADEIWSKINKEAQQCRACSTARSSWWLVKECRRIKC